MKNIVMLFMIMGMSCNTLKPPPSKIENERRFYSYYFKQLKKDIKNNRCPNFLEDECFLIPNERYSISYYSSDSLLKVDGITTNLFEKMVKKLNKKELQRLKQLCDTVSLSKKCSYTVIRYTNMNKEIKANSYLEIINKALSEK